MALDLESIRTEIRAHLDEEKLAVFHGYHHSLDTNQVFWDTDAHPDFREFVAVAKVSGVQLLVFHHDSFHLAQIDSALDQLEESDLSRDEKRSFETRLKQLQAYEGFTCSVELSFALDGRVYVYALNTEWYDAMNDILAELEAATQDDDEEDDGTLGGYFSKN